MERLVDVNRKNQDDAEAYAAYSRRQAGTHLPLRFGVSIAVGVLILWRIFERRMARLGGHSSSRVAVLHALLFG